MTSYNEVTTQFMRNMDVQTVMARELYQVQEHVNIRCVRYNYKYHPQKLEDCNACGARSSGNNRR